MGLCRGEGSVIHPREKGRYPTEGLADDLQELGVVLVASQILNVEPVDDRQDAAATTREELEHAVARVAEHEAVDAERACEDRYDDHHRGVLVVQGVDQAELVIIEGEQAVLDGEDLRGAKELLVSGKEEVYFLAVHSADVLCVRLEMDIT